MSTVLQDPTSRLLDLPAQPLGPAAPVESPGDRRGHRGVEFQMRKRRNATFSVYTARGMGSYRTRSAAEGAAHWVAQETGESVAVVDERTGERWDIAS